VAIPHHDRQISPDAGVVVCFGLTVEVFHLDHDVFDIEWRLDEAVNITIPFQVAALFLTQGSLVALVNGTLPDGLYVKSDVARQVVRITAYAILDNDLLTIG
jgi:hypothetical protein